MPRTQKIGNHRTQIVPAQNVTDRVKIKWVHSATTELTAPCHGSALANSAEWRMRVVQRE